MGEATYNNVYGNATLGEITRAMRGGQATGEEGSLAQLLGKTTRAMRMVRKGGGSVMCKGLGT